MLLSCSKKLITHQIQPLTVQQEWSDHKGQIKFACYNPGHQLIASVGVDGKIILSHVDTYLKVRQFPFDTKRLVPVNCLCFSQESHYIAAGNKDGLVRLWDLKTKQSITTINDHHSQISSMSWNYYKNIIASTSKHSEILMHNTKGNFIQSCSIQVNQNINMVRFSLTDSNILGFVTELGMSCFYDINKNKQILKLSTNKTSTTGISFTNFSSLIYTCGLDKRINYIDLRAKQIVKKLETQQSLTAVTNCISDLAVGCTTGRILLYDIRQDKIPKAKLTGHTSYIKALEFRPIKKKISKMKSLQTNHGQLRASQQKSITNTLNSTAIKQQSQLQERLIEQQNQFSQKQKQYLKNALKNQMGRLKHQTYQIIQDMQLELVRQFNIQKDEMQKKIIQSKTSYQLQLIKLQKLQQQNSRLKRMQI